YVEPEDGIRVFHVTGVQTCALPISVAPSADPVTITLSAREEYGRLVVSVSDDGRADRGGEPRPGYGIGLANVRERLAARFGKEATIVSGPAPGGGYSTLLRMPIVRKADELPL